MKTKSILTTLLIGMAVQFAPQFSRAQGTVHIRRFTVVTADSFTLDYAANMPVGFEIRSTAESGRANSVKVPGNQEQHVLWMRIVAPHFSPVRPGEPVVPPAPMKLDSSEQREAQRTSVEAQLEALQDEGSIWVTADHPKQVFSITNGSGEVFRGFFELVPAQTNQAVAEVSYPAAVKIENRQGVTPSTSFDPRTGEPASAPSSTSIDPRTGLPRQNPSN